MNRPDPSAGRRHGARRVLGRTAAHDGPGDRPRRSPRTPGGFTGCMRSAMTESQPAVHVEPTVRVLFSMQQIAARVRELGLEIARAMQGTRPLFVGVLKGACMFQCD